MHGSLQYVFVTSLRSLDRDYLLLISFPPHQSFIPAAPQEEHLHSLRPASSSDAAGGRGG